MLGVLLCNLPQETTQSGVSRLARTMALRYPKRQQSMLYPYPNFDKLKREDDELLSVLVAAAKAGLI